MPFNRRQLKTTLAQFYDHPVARVSLELFLSVGAVIFFAVFAIRPTLLTISDLLREIDQKEEIDGQLSQKVSALAAVQSVYSDVQGRLFVLDQAIPTQPDFITVAKIIEKIASDRELVISNLQVSELPSEITAAGGPSQGDADQLKRASYNLSFTINGDYLTIRNFVQDIINNRRMLVVDTVQFSSSETQGTRSLSATVTLSVPYFQ